MTDLEIPSTSDALDALRERLHETPDVALVLGSGLGELADEIEDAVRIPFSDVPGFVAPAVQGHRGLLVAGRLEGVRCIALQGRFHLYEGHSPAAVALPTRVMLALGARTLLVTNAAGGLNRSFTPGDLMLIDDHINLLWSNPLSGPVHGDEARVPDMARPYDPGLLSLAEQVAVEHGIRVRRGVYVATLGPSYETPAEIRMMQWLGGDAVGMSTVPEVLVARAQGARVLGISLITNYAAGIMPTPLSHDEVVAAGAAARDDFTKLVRGVLTRMHTLDRREP
ncbi:MAG TPA: purine-nucleoside phosphorylase [Longimicrobiales bacterium]|nr:purine-nucleoside phosphorylase [Longimicrobiales bacterium]